MTDSRDIVAAGLHAQLESQFARHMARLTALSCRRVATAGDEDAIAAARHAVAETAMALQRMADGTYGRCERCGLRLPDASLRDRPTARTCAPCRGRAVRPLLVGGAAR